MVAPAPPTPFVDGQYPLPPLPPSWRTLQPETETSSFRALVEFLTVDATRHTIYPPAADVFRALDLTALSNVRVLLLGQDPYHGEGQAEGLCFSVRPGVKPPGSLRNIFRELQSDVGVTPPAHGSLVAWARRGVLLLNAVLTVRAGEANSHAGRGWEPFTDAIIRRVAAKRTPVVFALWGAYAQKKIPLIHSNRHAIVTAAHPSPLSAHRGFLGSRPFSRINAALTAAGQEAIDWRLGGKSVSEPRIRAFMPRRRKTNSIDYPRDSVTAARIAAVAEDTIRRFGLFDRADRWKACAVAPADLRRHSAVLALDDTSEIPFVRSVKGVEWYQYRARLRCGDGDCYAVVGDPIEGYETYNRDYLGLGAAHLLRLVPSSKLDLALARALRADAPSFEALCGIARDAGGLLLHPYMGIEPVWELAEALGEEARRPVRVLGPLPHVTRLVNDKARFSEMVEALIGGDALARTSTSADPERLSELLREQTRRSAAVALKMPSCASGMGNRIFESAALRGQAPHAFRALVERFLADKEWDGQEPVLVVEWHRNVLESPSAQCWIPPVGGGEPEVEEVFEQQLLGEEQVFEGAVLSGLPRELRHDFMIKSWLLSLLFQRLGYVGRCSFDALVVGTSVRDARIKFVECNGRWGGTSTPMNLMKRVFGDFRSIPYRAQDYVDPRLRGLEFPQLLQVFDGQLYDRRTGKGRVLLYNVGAVREHGKFDLVVTGRGHAEIRRFINERIPRLIRRYLEMRERGTNTAP